MKQHVLYSKFDSLIDVVSRLQSNFIVSDIHIRRIGSDRIGLDLTLSLKYDALNNPRPSPTMQRSAMWFASDWFLFSCLAKSANKSMECFSLSNSFKIGQFHWGGIFDCLSYTFPHSMITRLIWFVLSTSIDCNKLTWYSFLSSLLFVESNRIESNWRNKRYASGCV